MIALRAIVEGTAHATTDEFFQTLVRHLAGARYFSVINDRYFRGPFEDMVARSVEELAAVGAAEWKNGTVANRDA